MQILVTGGAGFIGSHLCERLLFEGHRVTILDSATTGRLSNLSKVKDSAHFKAFEGSILDTDVLNPLIKDADYVFHLAAAVGVFNIVKNPLASLLTNIRGTENVLEAAYSSKTPVFLTSSSEVYGKNVADSLKESDDRILGSPLTLRWSYSEAKAIDESLAYAYYVERQLETRIVRFFNTVGPRQLGAYGMVVPRFVQAALANEPITIYGDGKQTRSFCYVSDLVEGIYKLLHLDKNPETPINLGNPNEFTILELAKDVIEIANSKSEIVSNPLPSDDPRQRCPDISLAKSILNWKPTIELREGIEKTAAYFKQII